MSKVHTYAGPGWKDFIQAMHSGQPVEIDQEMYDYWLEVLPPVYMRRITTLPDGKKVRATFGFAEGEENIVAFWREGSRLFCCQTPEVNRL